MYLKVFFYFGIVIAAFSVIVGLVYTQVYSNISTNTYINQLSEDAKLVAGKVSEYVRNDDYKNYPAFLEVLEGLETNDILIMTNPNNPMSERYANVNAYSSFPELDALLAEVFDGKISHIDIYSDSYESSYIFVGAPVTLADGSVVGAVLESSLAKEQKDVVKQSILVVVASVLFALVISGLIALWLARQITHPISIMRTTALSLAAGKYDTKTGIDDSGEIGELASSMDTLADRLLEAENARKDMEQMRIDFFANVSHELRTPITVMRAYTETLIDGVVKDEAKKMTYYDKMLGECKSMERLVGDLLLLSKMQNPDFNIDKEPLSLAEVLDDIIRSAGAIASERGIEIKTNIADSMDDDICLINGDYERLCQMFMVIVDNAVKFSQDGGTVEIIMTKTEEDVTVSIKDHGVGISEEELPYIFDKFYKSKLRQNSKGTGLGLAIARQICYKHEGTISVRSKVGEGTEFEFSFRRINADEQ